MNIASQKLRKWIVRLSGLFLAHLLLIQFADSAFAQTLQLQWDSNPESDVAGYNLYRSEEPSDYSLPLNAELIRGTSFLDSTVRNGRTYFYVLTAVSITGEESEYSNQVQAAMSSITIPNRATQLDAGWDQTVTLPATVTVSARAADDGLPNGGLSFQWSAANGNEVFFSSPTSATTEVSFPTAGIYILSVTVSDGQLVSTDSVMITVNPAGYLPPAGWGSPPNIETNPDHDLSPMPSPTNPVTSFDPPRGPNVADADPALRAITGHGAVPSTDAGGPSSGLAVVGYSLGGVLVSEAAFPASPLVESGRIFAEMHGSVNTGIAIANPNDEPVTLNFYFTDEWGLKIHSGTTTISANNELTAFLSQAPFRPPVLRMVDVRTFTFSASLPIAFTAIRGFTNERSEFLMSTLPVTPLAAVSESAAVFPYYIDGAGWRSHIMLVNPTETTIGGRLDFFTEVNVAEPTTSALQAGQPSESVRYIIPAGSALMIQTSVQRKELLTGWVRVTPAAGTSAPSGSLVFSRQVRGITVSESGVGMVQEGSAFRVYAEAAGNFRFAERTSMQSGVVISNSSESPALVNLELLALDGTSTGMSSQVSIPALGQARLFLDQIAGFQISENPFKGFIRVSGAPVSVVELKARYNERADFVLSGMPAIPETALALSGLHHYFARGAGYETAFITFNAPAVQPVLE